MIALVLGRTRWRRRRAVQQLLPERSDALGRSRTLIVTATHRKREQLLSELGDPERFRPEVVVYAELFATWWDRYGDGRARLGSAALTATALAMLREEHRWPTLAQLDVHDVAAELVTLHQERRLWGIRPVDAEVDSAVRALGRRVDSLGGYVDAARALEALPSLLAAPPPALIASLARPGAVVFDDWTSGSDLEAVAIVAACRAWARLGVPVVVTFASGRDRGGREAGVLFGWDPSPDAEPRFFQAAAPLRHRCFETLVASGEATVWVAGPEGAFEIDPSSEAGPEATADLADAYASGGVPPAGPLRGGERIRVRRFAHPAEEAETIADEIAARLSEGVAASECVIAVPEGASRSALCAALEDRGVPYRSGGGSALCDEPVAAGLRLALRAVVDGVDADAARLLAVADLALARNAEVDVRALRSACAASGIHEGDPTTWRPSLSAWAGRRGLAGPGEWQATLAATEVLAAELTSLGQSSVVLGWRDRTLALLQRLRPADGAVRANRAWASLTALVEEQARCFEQGAPGRRWTGADLCEALQRALADASFEPWPADPSQVVVSGFRDLVGLTPAHTFLGGWVRGVFPASSPARPFTAVDDRAKATTRALAEARAIFSALLRDASSEPWMRAVSISWPETVAGRSTEPAPLLADLLALGVPAERGVATFQFSGAARVRATPTGRAAEAARARLGALGTRDGVLDRWVDPPSMIAVTALETYLTCPARYWYAHVLRLAADEAETPELEPRRRGVAVHRILERFLRERNLAPLAGEPDRERAATALHEVAARTLSEIEAEGGFDPLFQAYARERWLAGLVDDRPAGALRVWLDLEIDGLPLVPEAVERSFEPLVLGPLRVRGTLDRVDRLTDGTRLVTDYKTGAGPTRSRIEQGLSLQPTIYAEVIRAETGSPTLSTFLSLRRPDDIRRTSWTGDPAALATWCPPNARRGAVPLDEAGRAAVLGVAAAAAERLVQGRFPPTSHPPDVAGCPSCPYRTICRVDPVRHGTPP